MWYLKTTLLSLYVCIFGLQRSTVLDSTGDARQSGLMWIEHDGGGSRIKRLQFTKNKKSYYLKKEGYIHGYQFSHIAVNTRNNQLMAFDRRKREIMGVELFTNLEIGVLTNSTLVWTVYSGTSSRVNGIAVDDKSNIVYWTDGKYETVFASQSHYESKAYALVDVDLENPYGIAIEPDEGFLFWSDIGVFSKIERSYPDGTNRRIIIKESKKPFKPTVLTIDKADKRLYWVDEGSRKIKSCDYDGQDVVTLKVGWAWITDLVFFQNQLIGLQSKGRLSELIFIDKKSRKTTRRHRNKKEAFGLATLSTRSNEIDPDVPVRCIGCSGLCVTGHDGAGVCTFGAKPLPSYRKLEPNEPETMIANNPDDLCRNVLILRNDGLYYLQRNFADLFGLPKKHLDSVQIQPFYTSNDYTGRFKVMALDPLRQYCYIYDDYINVLIKLSLTQGEAHSIHRLAGNVSDLTVDWLSGNIYYTDVINKRVVVLREDGRYSTTLLSTGFGIPQAVAINRQRRLLVFATVYKNSTTNIEVCSLDGTHRGTAAVVANNVTSLTVDSRKNVIFYSNTTGNIASIICIDMTTGTSKVLQEFNSAKVISMDVVNQYLVWIKKNSNGHNDIYATDKGSGDEIGFRRQNIENQRWTSLAFNHITWSLQTQGPCQVNNGGCDQLCLENNEGYRCACAIGYSIYKSVHCINNKMEEGGKFLLVADQIDAVIYRVSLTLTNMSAIPLTGLKQPYAVTYHYSDKMVYWSDLEVCSINRAHLNGSHQEILFVRKELYVTDMEMDPRTGTLYFVDFSYDRIGVLNVNKLTYGYIAVYATYKRPFGLAIDMKNGYMYVTSEGKISRLNLDGSECNTTTTWPRKPRGIAVNKNEIFWVEMPAATIYHKNLTSEKEDFISHLPKSNLFDIASDSNHIFVTNGTAKSITRLHGKNSFTVGKLYFQQPTGIHLVSKEDSENDTCSKACLGPCLKQSTTYQCLDKFENISISLSYKERCTVPSITYGYVKNNKAGAVVPNKIVLKVGCIPAHHLSSNLIMECNRGEWSYIPKCIPDYDIVGSASKGWVKFTEPGDWVFYVYDDMPDYIRVILIGGGGGGFDNENIEFKNTTKAGDGGDTYFGDLAKVFGGSGGRKDEGGKGGRGGTADGGDGTVDVDCSTGGKAGNFHNCLYCGNGGYSSSCSKKDMTSSIKSNCSTSPSGADAGLYGGGAGGNGGGSGGGGGYRCTYFNMKNRKNKPVSVTVGKGGDPSYGKAAPGFVLVTWGYGSTCVNDNVILTC